jgi:APA family basic amino acid/polyamine antiporter
VEQVSGLRRLVGGMTALCIGVGVAIGSGIFRVPGLVAEQLGSPAWIIAVWAAGGLFVLAAGLVTAELATRFPRAGGEYVYLREAYGEFAAFFFGWAYTVFIIGGGAATIAVALGEVTCILLGVADRWTPAFGVAAVAVIVFINCIGLRAGAWTQNALTVAKVAALLAVAALALLKPVEKAPGKHPWGFEGGETMEMSVEGIALMAMAAAFLQVLWAYAGSTDPAKLAEEVRDVRRAMPRALVGSALTLTFVYVLLNAAFLRVMSPAEMAESKFVANDVMLRLVGPAGEKVLAAITLLVCLGALASVMLATVRVTYALARDGLAPRALAGMSRSQAPVAALIAIGVIAMSFVINRGFREVLSIYMFAGAVLFSLTYASLLVFRRRERRGRPAGGVREGILAPADVFRCPAGPWLVAVLVVVQACVAWSIARSQPRDTLYTCVLLVVIALLYFVWRGVGLAARR